ncbi:MAG: S8 family serine peptidase [Pseudomonadota bacterium]
MTWLRSFGLLILLALAACAPRVEQAPQSPPWLLSPANAAVGADYLVVTLPLDEAAELAAVTERLQRDYDLELVAEWPLAAIDVHCLVLKTRESQNLDILIAALEADSAVVGVQPMNSFQTLATPAYADELFALQSGIIAMQVPQAHAETTGSGVKIGLVDTRVDGDHPDLAAQIFDQRDFIGDGRESAERHGTALAGIIAADAKNASGIVGIAPQAELFALRGCWEEAGQGACSTFSLARALNFALAQELEVLNLSLAGPDDPLLAELIELAVARGVVVVAAHSDDPAKPFPAALPGVIAVVAASETAGWQAGSSPWLPAPGADVLTTAPGTGYDFFSGSSVAAAHVTGLAALLLQAAPQTPPSRLLNALASGVENTGETAPTIDSCQALAAVGGGGACPGR